MKKLVQNLKNGKTELVDIPKPNITKNQVLIKTTHSLISLGTERMLVDFAKSNYINKALKQPEKVKMVIDKMKTDGISSTVDSVLNKLNEPMPLGYCNAGIVQEIGSEVYDVKPGDRVVSNGSHAEFVAISKNLVQKIPDDVKNEDAVFTVISSIALQGIRLCNPTYGEKIVVIGLGLVGLITVQLLKANGCDVIGIDLDKDKCDIAKSYGAITMNPKEEDIVQMINNQTNMVGADAVIITAATKSNDVISQAANISRKKGRIILVGVVGLDINRADFYEKELTFQVSCSYGPGRYDKEYEEKGHDYPFAYVRWTEKRNFECILDSISDKKLNFEKLITEILPFEDYNKIYDDINKSNSIASILEYSSNITETKKIDLKSFSKDQSNCVLGIIGAGAFTKSTLLPALNKTKASFKGISSFNGLNGTLLGKKYGFNYSTSDYNDLIEDMDIDTVFITTRHDSHAELVTKCINANKNVFVEKPLALNEKELNEIVGIYKKAKNPSVIVGFNRRFSPHIQSIRESLDEHSPVNIVATMNAGFIPNDHWTQDMKTGGGRIIGEACHYIDLCNFITGSKVKSVCMNSMGINPELNTDNASLLLKFEDGSNATINYFSNGSKSYSKERIEVYQNNSTYIMDNFRNTKGYNTAKFKNLRTQLDKGHREQFKRYIYNLKNGLDPIIDFNDIINATKASFAALESLKESKWINVI
tara:strand:+ start:219 stop:2336 length:2118 start_codon:yes stop_codon:yes gene_type:complete